MRLFTLICLLVLSGCASQPKDIGAAYVSSVQYQDYDCEQIQIEMANVSRRANELHGQLKETADNDAAQMGIGAVLFWPALLFLEGGDGPAAQEYARLKGEKEALEQAAVKKRCGLEFKNAPATSGEQTKHQEGAGAEADTRLDMQVWSAIKNSNNPADFQTFIEEYPDSAMVPFAKRRLQKLQ